ncbi:MAG TPA: PAS domain S-box protein [Methylomirabilota bacterium]|nr:PAS domain S-box protein [Methylomirabilota bacterium]
MDLHDLLARPSRHLIFVLVLATTLVAAATETAGADARSVLLIYGEARLVPAVVSLDQELRRTLEAGSKEPLRFYTEYIDLSWLANQGNEHLLRLLARKYAASRLDLIVVCGNSMTRLILRERVALFPDVPVVFCRLASTALQPPLPPGVTGVSMPPPWAATLELVRRLHSDTERVVFVGGAGDSDRGLEAQAREAFSGYRDRVPFIFLTGLPIPQLLQAIRTLPNRTVIVFGGFLRDGAGRTFTTPEALKLVAATSSAPIYSFTDTLLGHGIVGGTLISFEALGARTAELGLRVLRGEPLGSEVILPDGGVNMFDARQLQRWGISERLLPAGSIVQFRSPSAWELYRWPIVGATALIALQTALIAGLLLERRRRRRVQRGLAQAQIAMRESEQRFLLMAETFPSMLWLSGVDSRCTYFNTRWLEFTGRKLEEELGDGWTEGIHPDDVRQCLDEYRRAFRAREPFTLEYRLRRADGDYRWILDHGVPRVDASGEFLGYMGSGIDVTDIRAARQVLLEHTMLRSAAFSSLYGQLAAVDRDGVILTVNESWTQVIGESGADLARPPVGANYLAVCREAAAAGEPYAKPMLDAIESVLEGVTPRASFEYPVSPPAGERWFELVVEPFRRPEGGAIISHIDITRRRRAEEEARQQRDELAHVLRTTTMGELTAELAHEINQPLAAILTNAQAARRMIEASSAGPEDLREALTDISEDAKRAALIIGRLRALARREEARPEPVDCNGLVMGVVTLLRHDFQRKGITTFFDLAPSLPPVMADPVQLQQVLLNLLVNAADAVVAGAGTRREITVATAAEAAGPVELSVSDTGVGVPESDLERIFAPFVSTKRDGLGLGLSISRSIVTAHDGRMWATGKQEGGLTVHVQLRRVSVPPDE